MTSLQLKVGIRLHCRQTDRQTDRQSKPYYS